MKLKIETIQTEGLQARVNTEQAVVDDYAELMKSGTTFPPIIVFRKGKDHFLADGTHRLLAVQKNGEKTIECDVRQGGQAEALWFAAGSNQSHGLRRTNADKRMAVEIALKLKPKSSDRAIAEHCGVGPDLVGAVRCQLSENDSCPPPQERIGRDGRVRKLPPPPPSRPRPLPPVPKPPAKEEVEEPVEEPEEPAPKKEYIDRIGRSIPLKIRPLWDRTQEAQDHLTNISRLRALIKKVAEDGDPLYAEVNHQAVQADLDRAYTSLKTAIPYTVCPTCQACRMTGCKMCRERGFVSQFRWDTIVPKETKDLILKTINNPGE